MLNSDRISPPSAVALEYTRLIAEAESALRRADELYRTNRLYVRTLANRRGWDKLSTLYRFMHPDHSALPRSLLEVERRICTRRMP